MSEPRRHERRRSGDRRRRPTRLWQSLLRPSGRRAGDRRGDDGDIYVDRPRASTTVLVLFIVVSSAADAALTLAWIDGGGEEANPLMAAAMTRGTGAFLLLKCALTGVGVWLLAAHQNFRVGTMGLRFIACGYVGLLAYHAVLLLSA